MPELPEAETIARSLGRHIEGRRVRKVEFFTERVRGGPIPELAGRTARRVRRYGKQVVIELDEGLLAIQLRMTGLLRWRIQPGPYTRARIVFDHGAVCFDDIRQFGSIHWLPTPPAGLGPDPLEISPEEFRSRLRRRRAQIKRLLLDQRFLRGLGNIYADEVLFAAGIHPRAVASRLGAARAGRLHRAMVEVLTLAIEKGGSSVSDYVNADGRPGQFQFFHRVYGREGHPCPFCSTPIRKIVVAQRGTHYCPRCQRR